MNDSLTAPEPAAVEKPIVVTCRFCRDRISLNPDNEQTRKNKTDPRQQLRKHLVRYHLKDAMEAGRIFGWLVDMLCFASLDPRYDEATEDALAYFRREDIRELHKRAKESNPLGWS
jgi:hypothetical protein